MFDKAYEDLLASDKEETPAEEVKTLSAESF